jgi:hypothetical protein
MGLLAPGILRVGDVPQLAALSAPRRLVIVGGVSSHGQPLTEKQLKEAYAFTARAYQLYKAEAKLTLAAALKPDDFAEGL